MEQIIESVREGTLDFILTKPADAQLVSSIRRFDVWRLIDITLGLSVLVIALNLIGESVGLLEALLFVIVLLSEP